MCDRWLIADSNGTPRATGVPCEWQPATPNGHMPREVLAVLSAQRGKFASESGTLAATGESRADLVLFAVARKTTYGCALRRSAAQRSQAVPVCYRRTCLAPARLQRPFIPCPSRASVHPHNSCRELRRFRQGMCLRQSAAHPGRMLSGHAIVDASGSDPRRQGNGHTSYYWRIPNSSLSASLGNQGVVTKIGMRTACEQHRQLTLALAHCGKLHRSPTLCSLCHSSGTEVHIRLDREKGRLRLVRTSTSPDLLAGLPNVCKLRTTIQAEAALFARIYAEGVDSSERV